MIWAGSCTNIAGAAEPVPSGPSVGLSLAGDISDGLRGLASADLFLRYPLPWHGTPGGWHLNTHLWASAGWLKVGKHQTALISAGPLVLIASPNSRWYLEAGTRAALLTNQALGQRNLGYPLEFISHGELGVYLDKRLRIGSRIQHISNGGLDDLNPGLNLVSIQLIFNR